MPTETELRNAVVTEARSWLGTPWRHMGAVKGQCVDCAMLMAETYIRAGIVERFDPRPYPRLWFLHQNEERFLDWIVRRLGGTEIPVNDARPADLIVYRIGMCYAHGSILVSENLIIHAYYKAREVILTETWDTALACLEPRAFNMFSSRMTS